MSDTGRRWLPLRASSPLRGLVAFSVEQQTREIGIRIALGAERKQVVGMVLRQAALVR